MYDLELKKVVKEIKAKSPKTVLIQLPEGLKTKSKEIVDTIEKETSAKCMIWLGSCFGACDIPKFECDMLIQWGHSKWRS
tara:strand:- start:150 stop:389 length:240 start_codon:yes stop_codon:yes gene_type:complete